MGNLNKKLRSILLSPQGRVVRSIDSVFLLFSSMVMGLAYYSINYEICIADKCDDLVITRYWFTSSAIYVLFSAALVFTSIFIYKSRELPRLYSYAITIGMGAGVVLSSMMLFAIAREINLTI